MALYKNVIRNVQREEEDDEEKLGYEFWNKVENAPVIKQIGNYFQQNNANIQAMNEYARSKENDNLLSKGLAWTSYGMGQAIGAPFELIDMGLEEISDRTNIDKRSLKLGLDLLIASRGVKGSKTGAFNKGVQARQGINKQYNKLANIFKKPGDQLIDIKSTRVFDDVAGLSLNDTGIARLLNPIFTAKELGLDPTGTTFYSINQSNNNKKVNTGWNLGQPRQKNLTAPQYVDREMQRVGAKKVNGKWVITEAVYNQLGDAAKRNIMQIIQTDINQTVPYSFRKVGEKQTPEFNKEYSDYLTKYKGQPELHHVFPSALSSKFYFDVEYMGDEWKEMTAIAAEYGNYPGQPIAEGISNLQTYPSIKRGEKGVPPHLHNIIHNEILTNEIGQKGQKFFTKERLNRMNSGLDGKMEVWREWNEIIKNARVMSEEAMSQLEVMFSKGPLSENPEKLTDMLEQYVNEGEVRFGSGVIRDKQGKIVLKDGKPQNVDYVQYPINDIVAKALSDFKADAKLEFLGKDPRYTEVATEIKNFTHLDASGIDTAEDLLYDIKYYNGYRLNYGARKANKMIGGKDVYQRKLKQYLQIMESRMPNDEPRITTKAQLEATTFKDVKGPSIFKQLELIFND